MNPILARFDNQPALVAEEFAAWLEVCAMQATKILERIEAQQAESQVDLSASDDFWFASDDWRSTYRPYTVKNGILRVPVHGVLLNKFPWQLGGWATGYEYITQAVKRGLNDGDVKGIALDIDSGGGLVSGNFELVDFLYESRGKKPIKAFASDSAYSAAYSIASAADDISVTRSGGVGSIGVVATHIEVSERLRMQGVKVTFIFAGKHKVDGNPYEALPKGVRDKIQSRVDASYKEFVGLVARNREMDEKAIRDTEAQTYTAPEALEVGLADRIGGPIDDEITAFAATFTQQEDGDMAEKQAQFTESDLDSAKAEAFAAGETKGAEAERARITGILGSDEAKNRPAAAMLMVELGVDAKTAAEKLAKMPEETKAETPKSDEPKGQGAGAPKGMLEAAMKGSDHESLNDGDGTDDEKSKAAANEALLLNAGLPGFKKQQSK